jgi:hypothetical protein
MKPCPNDAVMIQLRGKVMGPVPICKLHEVVGFTPRTLISYPERMDKWAPAFLVLNLKENSVGQYMLPASGSGGSLSHALPSIFDLKKSLAPRVYDWVAPKRPPTWVDRWFRKMLLWNLLLASIAYAAGSSPAVWKPLQKEWAQDWPLLRAEVRNVVQRNIVQQNAVRRNGVSAERR